MIRAADKLMSAGAIATDDSLKRRGLVSGMTHLNTYAVPKNIEEKQAFAALKPNASAY